MKRSLCSFALIALFAPTVLGQSPTVAAKLPIKHVVLFSSGVGYFQREGAVEGNARVDLQFPTGNINDLLKSLVLQDGNGGQVSTINYDNRNPIEMTLRTFAIDLTQNPTLGDLLNQARGEEVEVHAAEIIRGQIVGVEKQRQRVGQDIIERSQLNMLTEDGLRGVQMSDVRRVRFLKPALNQDFHKALEVLATGHDKLKKTVSLNFTGRGKRSVKVGYVTENPIWKTSYRLSIDQDKLFLQGWAIVENTTDEDWNNVQVRLISGRPISFQMDLYQPLFVPRPVELPELFASLRPQTYGGDLAAQAPAAMPAPKGEPAERRMGGVAPPAPEAVTAPPEAKPTTPRRDSFDAAGAGGMAGAFGRSVASAASAAELGEFFQYAIKQPVSLPRQKSALIPIVNEELKGSTKVSIFNEAVHAKFPLLGLQFKNSTSLHLSQGPITVFENDSYAGDARIADLQPKETRLLSYAIDLGTEVEAKPKSEDELVKVSFVKGIIHSRFVHRELKTYTVKNRSEHSRLVLIEHPYRADFKLIAPEKSTERSRDVYRFELKAPPSSPVELVVSEELPRVETVALTNRDDESLFVLMRSKAASEKVKAALREAMVKKARVAEMRNAVKKEETALKVIESDQSRMRANMERVPQTSEAYKRYLKKFDDQETEIERRRARIVELQEKADQEAKAFDEFLTNLTVE